MVNNVFPVSICIPQDMETKGIKRTNESNNENSPHGLIRCEHDSSLSIRVGLRTLNVIARSGTLEQLNHRSADARYSEIEGSSEYVILLTTIPQIISCSAVVCNGLQSL